MSSPVSIDDLRLVVAIFRRGSIGAAARDLLMSQPSASTRLAAVERRLKTQLFDRDTTGARPTDAGRALAEEAMHILSHLRQLPDRVRAAENASLLRIATFPSLAAVLFPALDAVLADLDIPVSIHQSINHGDTLIDLVNEGSLDVAVIAIADQLPLPPQVTTTPLGTDFLAALTPTSSPLPRRKPFRGIVPYHCFDMSGPAIEERITALGGIPRQCATGEVAVLTARAAGQPALLANTIATLYQRKGECVVRGPIPHTFTVKLVTRTPVPEIIPHLASHLARRMGLVHTL